MKVYFAGSIRGGKFDGQDVFYRAIVSSIRQAGFDLLSEHAAATGVPDQLPAVSIYKRDLEWLNAADLMIAEVTSPSLGVGYEISKAELRSIPILCLYRYPAPLSAMIAGCPHVELASYTTVSQLEGQVRDWLTAQRANQILSVSPKDK